MIKSKNRRLPSFTKYWSGLVFLLITGSVSAQYSVYDFDPVIVTGSRIPGTSATSLRTITVIDQQTIATSGAISVSNLLESIAGIDVRSQGPNGIQADISIRGAGSEQTLILIDGVRLSDPQTAHHNMNLPVSLANIEKIEIVKGSGSKLYGANAFGGIVNIITRKISSPMIQIRTEAGDFGYYSGSGVISLPLGNSSNQLSVSARHSDGYRFNTDFDDLNIFYKNIVQFSKSWFKFSTGYRFKDFGANNFYYVNQANQREDTKTFFLNLNGNRLLHNGWLSTGISWRHHYDHYCYDYKSPTLYENRHNTDVIQADVQGTVTGKRYTHNVGLDLGLESIYSNRLGNHRRRHVGIIYENRSNSAGRLQMQLGISGYYYTQWGWNLMPGLDLRYQFNDQLSWNGSVGRAFRIPTFTELYYVDIANIGNPKLTPEKGWTTEQNLIRKTSHSALTAGIFYRTGIDQIDWVRVSDDAPWQVHNISEIESYGFESSAVINPTIPVLDQLSVSYSYITNRHFTGIYESKYLLSSLRNQLVVIITPVQIWDIISHWTIRYEDRLNYSTVVIFDASVSRTFNRITLSINGKNLLNMDYADYAGIPMPGRWLTFKIGYLWK